MEPELEMWVPATQT